MTLGATYRDCPDRHPFHKFILKICACPQFSFRCVLGGSRLVCLSGSARVGDAGVELADTAGPGGKALMGLGLVVYRLSRVSGKLTFSCGVESPPLG